MRLYPGPNLYQTGGPISLRIKFIKQDCWLGVYWYIRKTPTKIYDVIRNKETNCVERSLRIIICIIPTLPIIVTIPIDLRKEGKQ
jgi:hypothetical protein